MRTFGISAIACCIAQSAASVPISVTDAYHFVDRVGTNSFTSDSGLYLTFGSVGVTPNSTGGTSATYLQGDANGVLSDFSNSVRNEFARRIDYDRELTGSWELTFINEEDVVIVNTPEVGEAVPSGFVTDVTLMNPGQNPTFSWVNNTGADRIQIYIRDLRETVLAGGSADLIHVSGSVDGDRYTVPDGVLDPEGAYSIQIQADNFRDDGSLLSRSRVFFDFVAGELPDVGENELFLPQTDTTSGTPIFNFDNVVVKDTLAFYDPVVSIGYDYEIGEGDPMFRSVLLPDVGDGLFDLLLPNDDGGFDFFTEILAGSEYFFSEGVELFRILGIETSANLDPEDVTAFATGLSFFDDGRFTGSMTPITEEVSQVPLPTAGLLLVAGVAGFGVFRRKRQPRC